MIRGQEKSGRDYSTQYVKGKGRQLLLNHKYHRYTEIIKSKQQPTFLVSDMLCLQVTDTGRLRVILESYIDCS